MRLRKSVSGANPDESALWSVRPLVASSVRWDTYAVFERFTPEAREVVVRAQGEARALGHGSVDTEHELLAIAGQTGSAAALVLATFEITPGSVRSQVTALLGQQPADLDERPIPFTQDAKQMLVLSLRESIALGHDYIGPEHMLLAISHSTTGGAREVLAVLGASSEQIRAEVQKRLPPSRSQAMPRRPPESPPSGAWLGIRPFTSDDLDAALSLFSAEGWSTYTSNPQRTERALSAPGSTSLVAVETNVVVGLVQVQSDGEIQAHPSTIVVAAGRRRRGVARSLLRAALEQAGGQRIDLLSADDRFYLGLGAKRHPGFRLGESDC